MKFKTTFAVIAYILVLGGPCVFAADDESSVSLNKTKNPLTGTVTETKKYKRKRVHRDGSKYSSDITAQKKVKKNGEVERKLETDSSSTSK